VVGYNWTSIGISYVEVKTFVFVEGRGSNQICMATPAARRSIGSVNFWG
jgi:hypothetical protein